MEQIWALVKDGMVVNAIIADAAFIEATAGSDLYQEAVDVTEHNPRPGPGWRRTGQMFLPPEGA